MYLCISHIIHKVEQQVVVSIERVATTQLNNNSNTILLMMRVGLIKLLHVTYKFSSVLSMYTYNLIYSHKISSQDRFQ